MTYGDGEKGDPHELSFAESTFMQIDLPWREQDQPVTFYLR
jgi:hypothetical protein